MKVTKLIENVEKETESSIKEALVYILYTLNNIEKSLKPKKSKVYKQPTNNAQDIIIGGCHINNTETR